MTVVRQKMAEPDTNRPAIEFHLAEYTPADLQGVPLDNVVAFLMVGQLHNEVNILIRQVILNRNDYGRTEPENAASFSAAFTNMRMLAARLEEGAKLLKGRKVMFRNYLALQPRVLDIFNEVLRYSSNNTNLLHLIRNKAGFHSDIAFMTKAWSAVDPAERLVDFHVKQMGNSVFFSAETTLMRLVCDLVGEADPTDALNKMNNEVIDRSNKLRSVIEQFSIAFYIRHMPSKLKEMRGNICESPAVFADEFVSPVFVQQSAP